jgi:serine/threonine protein kinase
MRALSEQSSPPPPPRFPGDVLGGYVVGEQIGRGAFSVVHEAIDFVRGRTVAIKMLRAGGVMAGALAREAKVVGRLDHPNVIALHGYGVDDGTPYLVLERLRGESLDRRLASAPLSVDAALDIGVAVVRGVAYVHAWGIVHADIKPANVFVCDDGAIKLLDFGLADLDPAVGAPANDSSGGTPAYMAPERLRGQRPSYASDVFALGTLLYEMLHGERPRHGAARKLLPPPLEALLARALAVAPEARFADGRELLEALLAARSEQCTAGNYCHACQ